MSLAACASLTEYFRDVLSSALRNQRVDATTATEFYLVNLLAQFSNLPVNDEALGLKLVDAQTKPPEERLHVLRDVGDQTLYISGLFGESLERRHVDVDYYVQIGGMAYRQLSRHARFANGGQGATFAELSEKFDAFVEVLAEVGVGTNLGSATSLMALYERWLRTGSEWTERRLREAGLVPRRGDHS